MSAPAPDHAPAHGGPGAWAQTAATQTDGRSQPRPGRGATPAATARRPSTGLTVDGTDDAPSADPAAQSVLDAGGKPTRYLALLHCAAMGDAGAREVFATWVYGVMRRVLRGYGRRWSADDLNDAVQHAVWHIVERAGHCRAENDYQLRAWMALVGWRAVLRERVERRSLDARPGAGRRGAGAAGLPDDSAAPPDPPEPTPPQLTALVHVLSSALHAPSSAGGPARKRVEAALTREHAAFARALLCRVTVEAYAGLPAPTQRMFWTRLVEGATWAAVAADAGTSEAAAKRRLQRASRTLAGRVAARVRDLSPEHAAVVEALCHRLGVELPMAVRGRPPAVHRA